MIHGFLLRGTVACLTTVLSLLAHSQAPLAAPPIADTMAQRMLACTMCHGKEGVATNQGYFPRIAGKPADYLYQQLIGFRERRRNNVAMAYLLDNLSDAYLVEIAQYFSALDLPYPPPQPVGANSGPLAKGAQLVLYGDPKREIPPCVACHGAAMTGRLPSTPGLLGLPRDYVVAQIGAWKTGLRKAAAPDCMAQVARRLNADDINAVSHWLASRTVPDKGHPAPASRQTTPIACLRAAPNLAVAAKDTTASTEQVARGAYLARAGNCQSCHTQPGGAAYAGGRGIPTPFGTVYAGNLTPDPATGIGAWNATEFWRALHNGRSRDGRLLYPAFPYSQFTRVTQEDSDALLAYLRTVPAVVQANRAHDLRYPYNTQAALAVWRALFFTPTRYQPQVDRSAQWNRGAYLVQGLGHCAACHAPRNALGGMSANAALAGGAMPEQAWYVPSLQSVDEGGIGIGDGGEAELVTLLQNGVSPHAVVNGPMAEVVRGSTQFLAKDDLQAMAVYLLGLAPVPTTAASAEPAMGAVVQRGAKLYKQQCAHCHGEQGQGAPGIYPHLAGNRAVTLSRSGNLIQVVLHGGFAPATVGNPRPYGMPPFGQALNNREVADVLSFIRQAWGNRASEVSELDVLHAREPNR